MIKNPRMLSIILLLVGEIVIAVFLFLAARHPQDYGFVLLGAAVGWMLYYFIRRYKVFSPKTLTATVSAIIGGEALAWLAHLRGSSLPIEAQYFTGLGIGFFLYALYAGFCSWLYAAGIIPTPVKFEIAAGCGAGVGRELDEVEAVMEFERKTRDWIAGLLTDEQMRDAVDNLEISRRKLAELIELGETELKTEEIEKIRKARIVTLHAAA